MPSPALSFAIRDEPYGERELTQCLMFFRVKPSPSNTSQMRTTAELDYEDRAFYGRFAREKWLVTRKGYGCGKLGVRYLGPGDGKWPVTQDIRGKLHEDPQRNPGGQGLPARLSAKRHVCMKTILVDAVDTLVIEQDGSFKVFGEMRDLLETFPNRKIVLTMADDEGFRRFNLDGVPYEIFTSKHNPDKTDPEYYRILLKRFGLGKDDVVYFEHNPDAVKSAESVGIKSYWYDPEKRDLVALKRFLTQNL